MAFSGALLLTNSRGGLRGDRDDVLVSDAPGLRS